MKILHTGDWHMNHRLGKEDRSSDIIRALEKIAEYLDSESVDVMVVAGDLFCDRSSKEDLKQAIGEIQRIFAPFLQNGGTIVSISGNHDSDVFFATIRSAMELAPGTLDNDKVMSSGRAYFFNRPNLIKLRDKNGEVVQFALMPWPGAGWIRDIDYDTASGQRRKVQDLYTGYLKDNLLPKVDPTLPCVLVSHILVKGITTGSGFELSEEHDIPFAEGDIPTHLAYVAYGHIHQPQEAARNAPWVRYCGSVERLNSGEAKDKKSVVVVDVGWGGMNGRLSEPRLLPIEATRIEEFVINDPDKDLPALVAAWQEHPERTRMLVKALLHYRPATHSRDALTKQIRTLFPRCYYLEVRPISAVQDGKATTIAIDLGNVEKTVTDYVEANLKTDHPLRADILNRLKQLIGPGHAISVTNGQEEVS